METGVPGEKPLQAKLRADYFSLPLFLYLQCLKQKELKNLIGLATKVGDILPISTFRLKAMSSGYNRPLLNQGPVQLNFFYGRN